MEKESGIKYVAFIQAAFNYKINSVCIKSISSVRDSSFEL
jgi:hypothetical protein